MWEDVLKNTKQGKVFREFIEELMNVEVEYDEKVEMNNTSENIAGVIT